MVEKIEETRESLLAKGWQIASGTYCAFDTDNPYNGLKPPPKKPAARTDFDRYEPDDDYSDEALYPGLFSVK